MHVWFEVLECLVASFVAVRLALFAIAVNVLVLWWLAVQDVLHALADVFVDVVAFDFDISFLFLLIEYLIFQSLRCIVQFFVLRHQH